MPKFEWELRCPASAIETAPLLDNVFATRKYITLLTKLIRKPYSMKRSIIFPISEFVTDIERPHREERSGAEPHSGKENPAPPKSGKPSPGTSTSMTILQPHHSSYKYISTTMSPTISQTIVHHGLNRSCQRHDASSPNIQHRPDSR